VPRRVRHALPGSRRSEIEYNAPTFLEAAAQMQRARPGLQFVLPVIPGLRALIESALERQRPAVAVTLLDGRSHEALAACDVTLIASGTATLEAALFKRPMVIAYRMHALSWQMMKRMRLQPWVGLPNILLEDFAVPELLQSDASPQALARETLAWLEAPQRVEHLQERFTTLHHTLRCGTARTATDAIAQIISR